MLPARHRPTPSPERRRLLLTPFAMLASAVLPTAQAHAQAALDLAQLMQLLAQGRHGRATFTETRYVAMLERPLESSGILLFEPPDSFVRETLKPRREKLAVVGNSVTMSQGTRSRTVSLDSAPEAAILMEAIRGTLTGDREAIEGKFGTAVAGNAERWSLELTPRDQRLRDKLALVRVSGQQGVVREVAVTMADGDRSVMRIEPVAPAN